MSETTKPKIESHKYDLLSRVATSENPITFGITFDPELGKVSLFRDINSTPIQFGIALSAAIKAAWFVDHPDGTPADYVMYIQKLITELNTLENERFESSDLIAAQQSYLNEVKAKELALRRKHSNKRKLEQSKTHTGKKSK